MCGLDGPEENKAFGESNEISRPIGYRAVVFMKAVDEPKGFTIER